MQKSQFRQAYRTARIGQVTSDTLESLAAIIALDDRQKPDIIGKVYRDSMEFLDFLEARHEKRERLADLRAMRRAKRGSYQVDLAVETVEPEVYHDAMQADFDQLFDGRG